MNEVIKAALEDFESINARKDRWADFEYLAPNGDFLTVGVIHPDGFKEAAILTRTYYPVNDSVTYKTILHS